MRSPGLGGDRAHHAPGPPGRQRLPADSATTGAAAKIGTDRHVVICLGYQAKGRFVAGQVVPMRVGDVEVLVQTIPVAGTEKTSTGDVSRKALDAFRLAQEVIVGAAVSTLGTVGELASRAARPDKLEVEFGLGFSVKGNVIVVGGQADATLKVKLTYDARPPEA
jgi:Trypsin-co-occurring domain 1